MRNHVLHEGRERDERAAGAPAAVASTRHTSGAPSAALHLPPPVLAPRHARRVRLEAAGPGLYRVRGTRGAVLVHLRIDGALGSFHLERRLPPAPGGRVRILPLGDFWRLDDALDAVGAS